MKTVKDKKAYYSGEHLQHIAYPLGGLGAGMFCVEGTGALSQFSICHSPNVPDAPNAFAALAVKTKEGGVRARVLEGNVPRRKIWDNGDKTPFNGKGNGLAGRNYGLPRFGDCVFHAEFPFAEITLNDADMPFTARITAHSPFIPSDDVNSCLPAAALEYSFANDSGAEA